MKPTPGVIRTPDQRLRVFVSSTLKELAPERRVTRAAVERLHLAPVMFELGARPHPPRELYRAYLQQSDVFVGIYGDSYGWVAPGEAVSGLEDEYNLGGSLPKLIYIRESTAGRDDRLGALLDRVRDDDRASFKYFSSPQELRKLIEADLATLLAERFDQSRTPQAAETAAEAAAVRTPAIPVPLTGLIGRDREVAAVEQLLARDAVRLVTMIGPGGIGKSRVAMAVAAREREEGEREVVFVDLTPVQDVVLVPNAIAQALGVLDIGDEAVLDKLMTALRERHALIVVDNFEQVLPAATTLTTLLAAAPAVKFLVTSRTLLRVSGEYAVEVGPLELPDGSRGTSEATVPASVALFVERARAVKPDFELNSENATAIAAICVALDGVPLALELAAARIRMLTPESMLARLDRRLSLLSGGARDLPARQQTLRSTIEWSTQLLGREERQLLEKLGVFSGGFSLDAVEAVAGADGADPVYSLGVLVDNSLVREQDRGGQPNFSMLATVREYALEQLGASGALEATRAVHAAYYARLAKSLETDLEDGGLRDAIAVLNADRDNLRAAARYYLDSGDLDAVAEFTWTLLVYWWVGGLLGEVKGWMEEVLAAPGRLHDRTRAIALYFTLSITLWHDSTESVVPGLTESAELFHRAKDAQAEGLALLFLGLAGLADKPPDPDGATRALEKSLEVLRSVGDDWGEAMALVTLGRVALMKRALHEAIEHFEASLSLARRRRDDLGTAIALHHLGWATLVQGDKARARELFEESLATAARLGHAEGVAYGLEGLTAIAAAEQDVSRAGRLLRASESLRNQTGLHTATRFSFHEHYLAPILAGEHAEELERVRTEGSDLSIEDAVKFALEPGA